MSWKEVDVDKRRLFVAWRDPEERRIWPVGVLTLLDQGEGTLRYSFSYLKGAEQLHGFKPFASFPDLYRLYESERLFPLFENRLMPKERPDFDSYLRRLHLSEEADPFTILGASGGMKATDRVEVFPEPELDQASGKVVCRFFVRGIQYIPGAEERVAQLRPEDWLELLDEPDNPVNSRAIRLMAGAELVGYAPDYLVEFLHEARSVCGGDLQVSVVHTNPATAPVHMRLLCRVETCPWARASFDAPEYQPLGGSYSAA
jgi:hypothetical protein